jgi:L-idonate 5-dehydrogenase
MKTVVIHAARDLRVEQREPETPGAGQVEVAIEAGGICGSDLHYFNHGGFGTVRVREPMILGHEVAGSIKALGASVSGLAIGDRVAVSPSRPCNGCDYCLKGQQNQCLNMRFYGSAMPMPHIQGAFRQRLVAEAWQCHKVADGVSANEAAFAEPFAVVLHAVSRAGSLLGKRVLVTGCGPIGALAIMAARLHGAREIVATDVVAAVLEKALRLGADRTINVAEDPEQLGAYAPTRAISMSISKPPATSGRSARASMCSSRAASWLSSASAAMSRSRRTWWWPRRSKYAAPFASTRSSAWPST